MEDLSNVRPGDYLFHEGRFEDISIVSVYRVTKTQIVIRFKSQSGTGFYEVRYWKKNGRMVGADTWDSSTLRPLTPERRKRVELINAKRRARQIIDNIRLPDNMEDMNQIMGLLVQVEALSAKS